MLVSRPLDVWWTILKPLVTDHLPCVDNRPEDHLPIAGLCIIVIQTLKKKIDYTNICKNNLFIYIIIYIYDFFILNSVNWSQCKNQLLHLNVCLSDSLA